MHDLFVPPRVRKSRVGATTLLTIEDPTLPIVNFAVAVKIGSLFDPIGSSGLTKMLLTLMLRGTKTRSRHAFNIALEKLGSSLDASVGPEMALFRGVSLTRNLDATVSLLSEALYAPALEQEELDSLLQEHIEGLRAERDDDDVVADLFLREALYGNHKLSRSANGNITDLATLTAEKLSQAHKALFSPADMICGFAGDITEARAQILTSQLTAALPYAPKPDLPPPFIPQTAPLKIVFVDKPDRTQVQLRLATHTLNGTHQDLYPFWLGAVAFGGTFTSLFCREVRDIRGWSYVAQADFRRRTRYLAPLILRTAPANKDAIDCLALELELYSRLANGDLDPVSIELSKSYLLNRYPFELQNGADMLYPAIVNELLDFAPDEIIRVPDRLSAIGYNTVPSIVRRSLENKPLIALLVASKDALLKSLEARFKDASMQVIDFREGLADEV
jgi:zinc protease